MANANNTSMQILNLKYLLLNTYNCLYYYFISKVHTHTKASRFYSENINFFIQMNIEENTIYNENSSHKEIALELKKH